MYHFQSKLYLMYMHDAKNMFLKSSHANSIFSLRSFRNVDFSIFEPVYLNRVAISSCSVLFLLQFHSAVFPFYCILLKKSPAISNHTSVSSQLSSSLLYVDSHSSSQSLNTHTPPSVSLSVIGSETDLIVWTSVSQTGHKLLYLWLLCLLLAGIY